MANTARRIPLPTPVELEILQLVWNLKTATVRDVYEAILEQRRIAYTTVMTMMNIMERKGILRKAQQQGRAFIYKAAHTRERVNKASEVPGFPSQFLRQSSAGRGVSLGLRFGNAGPNPFNDQGPLKLRDRRNHGEHGLTHGGGRINLLGDRDEVYIQETEFFEGVNALLGRAGKAIEFPKPRRYLFSGPGPGARAVPVGYAHSWWS